MDDDYEFGYAGFPFTFRDPEDVFREFFGGSPFADLLAGKCSVVATGWCSKPQDQSARLLKGLPSYNKIQFSIFENIGSKKYLYLLLSIGYYNAFILTN